MGVFLALTNRVDFLAVHLGCEFFDPVAPLNNDGSSNRQKALDFHACGVSHFRHDVTESWRHRRVRNLWMLNVDSIGHDSDGTGCTKSGTRSPITTRSGRWDFGRLPRARCARGQVPDEG
jgi:hypothetical protein